MIRIIVTTFLSVLFLKNFSQGNVPEENLLIDCVKITEVNDCCDVRGNDFSVYSEKLVTFCDKVTCSLHARTKLKVLELCCKME